MTSLTSEDVKILREFNRNIAWLKAKEIKEKRLITANELTKKTGWDKEVLRRKRMRGEIYFEKAKSGGYRYHDIAA